MSDRSARTWQLAVLNLVLPVGTLTVLAHRLWLADWGRLWSLYAWFAACVVVHVISMVKVIRGRRALEAALVTVGLAAHLLLAAVVAATILLSPPIMSLSVPSSAPTIEVPGRDVPLIDIDGRVVIVALAAMGLAATLAHVVLRRRRTKPKP